MTELNTTTEQTETKAKEVELTRSYFGNDQLEQALAYFEAVSAANPDLPVDANFDLEGDVPTDGGLVVFPVNTRKEVTNSEGKTERQTVTSKIMIAAVPSVASILAGEAGDKATEYAEGLLSGAFMDKLALSEKNGVPLPVTVEDFVTIRGRGSELSAYNAVASTLVTNLKKKGMKTLTNATLRACLESAEFAGNMYETVEQAQWVQIIDVAAALATKDGKDTAIFEHWKATRDQKAAPQEEINLDLSDLLG